MDAESRAKGRDEPIVTIMCGGTQCRIAKPWSASFRATRIPLIYYCRKLKNVSPIPVTSSAVGGARRRGIELISLGARSIFATEFSHTFRERDNSIKP
ncbi:hypothetical protein PUN28_006932 [Cardiocondyla obscurior]|uniref:Uncharacterized protein n=1 Tax=Cardiocondyla obscurior TaxID=286306 RepID=A0AAW2G0U3_9HYME